MELSNPTNSLKSLFNIGVGRCRLPTQRFHCGKALLGGSRQPVGAVEIRRFERGAEDHFLHGV